MRPFKSKFRTFEQLESRYALAGNVTATIDGSGNLLILGDSLANGVKFTETSTGKFALTGINAGSGATRINGGAPNNTVNFSGITGSVTFRMLGGNDSIQIPYFNYGGWMILNTGDGNDSISLGSNAKASYLVGVLSIRTEKGADTITENNINVIGNQDFAAAQTDEADATGESSKKVTVTITNCTYGAFLYFNFGGRAGSLTMDNTIQAGNVYINNEVEVRGTDPLHLGKIIAIGDLLEFNYSNSSMDGNLSYRATSRSSISMTDSIVLGTTTIYSVGSSNSMVFDGSYLGGLSTQTATTYGVATGHETHYSVPVKSSSDNVELTNVFCTGDLNLQSYGTLTLEGVAAENATLSNTDNSDGLIHVGTSQFTSLRISLGAAGEFDTSSPGDNNQVEIITCVIEGTLSIDPTTRASAFTRYNPFQFLKTYNRSTSKYDITASSIGSLVMNTVVSNETPPVTPGPMIINVNSSVIGSTDLTLPLSNDTLKFTASTVSQSTIVNGGGGTNTFINSGSNLKGLKKTNFL